MTGECAKRSLPPPLRLRDAPSWFESRAVASHPLQPDSFVCKVRCGGTPQPARETHALPKRIEFVPQARDP